MKTLGLIGNPVAHSKSPEIFQKFFKLQGLKNWDYRLFPLESLHDLPGLIENHPDICGFNVTIPFKESIIPMLDAVSTEALQIGAVNTVVVQKNDSQTKLLGFNTDVFGIKKTLAFMPNLNNSKVLILGTGGASRAVQFVLQDMKMDYTLVSRNSGKNKITFNEITEEIIQNHAVIIQTTPLGMVPSEDEFPPIPYEFISKKHVCLDLIYNPSKTRFLQLAEEKGAYIQNGMPMLQHQAEKAWELFYQSSKI